LLFVITFLANPSPAERATDASTDDAHAQGASARMSWARLLKRVFDIDIEHCPNCAGSLKIIAAIEDPPVIVKILSHLGLPTRAPPRAPAQRRRANRALPTAASPEPAEATLGFSSTRKTIDNSPVRRYCSGQKKRWFKFPIHCRDNDVLGDERRGAERAVRLIGESTDGRVALTRCRSANQLSFAHRGIIIASWSRTSNRR
jgi:hypothetical protein